MLPPVSPALLERNPRFKALYQNLATSRLNSDASTRLIKQQRAQADVEKVGWMLADVDLEFDADELSIATHCRPEGCSRGKSASRSIEFDMPERE
jgi:hypothetical protein